ncbi:putative sulfotransferase family cytosolic 1B member 1 [Apostichopus japonicus]|uniref:Putative sulfotransferase family cytosolic 1B member 1 n=1 Tax=Stichopus japonicus TaxID=307972 RepID=A0A2G8KUW8_STIJA|nr:putative sulfotransferase family cytosolic 1B member 1 [Apostichopus japonicus]
MSAACVDSAKLIADAARVQCDSKGGHDTWKKVYKYKGYTVSWMQSPENLEALQTFEVKDDDIFCVTYPKAGTHWIWEIISLLLAEGDVTKLDRSVMNTMLDLTLAPSPELAQYATPGYKTIETFPSPRVIPTHVMEPCFPPQWKTKKPKVIYFARNPKDLLVSFFHFAKDSVDPEFSTWEGFMKLFLSEEVPNGSWFDHVLRYWKHKDEPNFLFLKYEDCHKDLKSSVAKVAKFP